MADIAELKAQRFQEQEMKRHNFEIKKLRAENYRQYQKEVKAQEAILDRMRSDYETEVTGLENELEKKLIMLRKKQEDQLKTENTRLDEEVRNLKLAHQDQVEEIKASQQNEINNMNESHRRTMDNARQKFLQEKAKIDA